MMNYLQTLAFIEEIEKQLANNRYWLEKSYSEKVKKNLLINIEMKEKLLQAEKEKLPILKEEYKKAEIERLTAEIEKLKAL